MILPACSTWKLLTITEKNIWKFTVLSDPSKTEKTITVYLFPVMNDMERFTDCLFEKHTEFALPVKCLKSCTGKKIKINIKKRIENLRLNRNIESNSSNNTYLNIIEILFLFFISYFQFHSVRCLCLQSGSVHLFFPQ